MQRNHFVVEGILAPPRSSPELGHHKMIQSESNNAVTRFTGMLERCTEGLNSVATMWTFLLVFVVTADVLGRFVFNSPIVGTPEIVAASLVGIAFLYMPHTTWMCQHIRSDVLRPIVERRYPHIIDLPASFIGCAVFFLISFANWGDMVEAWSVGEWEGHGDFHLLTAPFRTILVGGAALSSLSYGIHCGRDVLDLIARQKGRR